MSISFSIYIKRRLANSSSYIRILIYMFIKSFKSTSFSQFWRVWNPFFGYYLIIFIYRPLKRFFSRKISLVLTFLFSGLFIHDLPLYLLSHLLKLNYNFPFFTICFFYLSILLLYERRFIWLAKYLGFDLSFMLQLLYFSCSLMFTVITTMIFTIYG